MRERMTAFLDELVVQDEYMVYRLVWVGFL